MRQIRLLATDLDGTLIGCDEPPEAYQLFRDAVRTFRARWGMSWAIVTGRHAGAIKGPLVRLAVHGLTPDFLVLEDARIYRHNAHGKFRPFRWWNYSVGRRRRALLRQYRHTVRGWRDRLLDAYPEAEDLSLEGSDLWFRFTGVADAKSAEAALQADIEGEPRLLVFRWGWEVYLGPVAGSKGDAVSKLARTVRVEREDVFAVGDGPNDVSMLNGGSAASVACVGNAVPEVKQVVRDANGCVASGKGLAGVLEALDPYIQSAQNTG